MARLGPCRCGVALAQRRARGTCAARGPLFRRGRLRGHEALAQPEALCLGEAGCEGTRHLRSSLEARTRLCRARGCFATCLEARRAMDMTQILHGCYMEDSDATWMTRMLMDARMLNG